MILDDIYDAIVDGHAALVSAGVQQALDEGHPLDSILNEACIPAMDEVGRLFEAGDFFVPEMLISAHAMKAGMEILKPLLTAAGVEPIASVVVGTVAGDMHDIGKNLVVMMLEGAGFEVFDLGVDVKPAAFIEAINTHQPAVVGMSALLTTTMDAMRTTIVAFDEAGVRNRVKIMVGGAPVTEEFADAIGADGYAADAGGAVPLARSFLPGE